MSEPTYLHAVRTAYDTVAVSYAEILRAALDGLPFERALLAAFAEEVRSDGGGLVGDLGCGPGRLTGHLRGLGLDVFGVDLSPGMIAEARRLNPGVRFEVGSIISLDLADGALAGIVAWYSIIHTPPELLPVVFAEFHRVLAPGGRLVIAFHIGDGPYHLSEAYGHELSLDVFRLPPDGVAELLREAGFAVHARLIREAEGQERSAKGHLFARRA